MFEVYIRATAEVCYKFEKSPFTKEELEIIGDGQAHKFPELNEKWRVFEKEMLDSDPADADTTRILYLGVPFANEIDTMYNDGECVYQV